LGLGLLLRHHAPLAAMDERVLAKLFFNVEDGDYSLRGGL